MQALSPENGTPFRYLGPNAVPSPSSDGPEPLSTSSNGLISMLYNPQLGSRLSQRPATYVGGVTKPPRQQDFSVWRLAAALVGVPRGPSSRNTALGARGIKPGDEQV